MDAESLLHATIKEYNRLNNLGLAAKNTMDTFKIGDKVVPISKSTGCPLHEERNWNEKGGKEQGYLVVNNIDNHREIYMCGHAPGRGSNHFKPTDLIPYIENPDETIEETIPHDPTAFDKLFK